ncbi:MAG: rod shape-determining protein MreC, partial [Nitrospirae bacterium]|nr:rod shape-determining protein MreC [Nitrospirota bacterium]
MLQEEATAAGRMRELLDLRSRVPRPLTAAQVIGRDPTNWYRMVVLDKGEKEGVASNRVVVSPDGVVGRIVKTSPHSSRVLLISDRSSALA